METTNLITKTQTGYILEHVGGPYKVGLLHIVIEGDETSLAQALAELKVPKTEIEIVLPCVHSQHQAIVTFDAKVMEPL